DRWKSGAALVIGSIAIWTLEMAVINRIRGPHPPWFNHWGVLYGHLGGSLEGVLATLVRRPWLFLWSLIYPLEQLRIVGWTLLQTAFLPLASGLAAIPLIVAWIPQQLTPANDAFHNLLAHYASFISGPLIWTSIQGMLRLFQKPERRYLRA